MFWCANQTLKVQNSTVTEDSETNSCSLEIFFIWLQCGSGFSVAMVGWLVVLGLTAL